MTKTILNSLFDLILPRFCEGCKTKLAHFEEYLCSSCSATLEIAEEKRIIDEFKRKFSEDLIISDFNSAFVFHNESAIQKLIHSLKYEQNFLIGKYLGVRTYELLRDKIKNWHADLIIPIPLHHLRKAERGFNQSKEIAKGVSSKLNIKVNDKVVRRKRFTKTQTKFSLEERKVNIDGAFCVTNKKKIKGKKIILIDDVITTGATTKECAKMLLENGAAKVYALSVALAD